MIPAKPSPGATARALRATRRTLHEIRAALVAAGVIDPDEGDIVAAVQNLCESAGHNATHIRAAVSTPVYGATTLPTRSCPDCNGVGSHRELIEMHTTNGYAGLISCIRCGGSGEVVAT